MSDDLNPVFIAPKTLGKYEKPEQAKKIKPVHHGATGQTIEEALRDFEKEEV